jgi:hypothetical protein
MGGGELFGQAVLLLAACKSCHYMCRAGPGGCFLLCMFAGYGCATLEAHRAFAMVGLLFCAVGWLGLVATHTREAFVCLLP